MNNDTILRFVMMLVLVFLPIVGNTVGMIMNRRSMKNLQFDLGDISGFSDEIYDTLKSVYSMTKLVRFFTAVFIIMNLVVGFIAVIPMFSFNSTFSLISYVVVSFISLVIVVLATSWANRTFTKICGGDAV